MQKQAIYAYSLSGKNIRVSIVSARLRMVLDPKGIIGVDTLDPLTDFFDGANPALVLPDMISSYKPFHDDKLKVTEADISKAKTVHDVTTIILRKYKQMGWKVLIG
ncbi:MAG: hypothetical protein E5V74_03120 [Mesorhizobium sp.]|nr:MAG: hypothetical protein E5W03_02895 [Mesorhizobium sp.]TIV25114.1 MAG: hypothetical protein E5W02_00615 [Mesorhizobium sp.]TIV68254.1 MAG: hypothetical protein E5V86_01600 [Mesorhizobium sp.]TIW05396.1 MAG: hypothetical protein E5V74_03120 [Mesorhizobium sp.]